MNKLITTIGSMLFVCMIFTSCSSDKKSEENKAPKLTEKQIEIKKGAEIFCEFFKIAIQIRDMDTQYELTGEYEDEEKYLLLSEEYNIKDLEMSNYLEMMEKKYENDEDNLKIAQAEFNFFKKECEKCKSDIDKLMGWDTFFNSMEQEMLSDYDAAGNPIEENEEEYEDEYVVGQNLLEDGYTIGECACQLGRLENSLENEYNEDVAMEFEAVNEYCEELMNELDYYYEEDDFIRLEELMMKYLEEECIVE